ncbi:MAG: NADH-quinone oxidoreductase subunit N [Armatimonadota bacterium]
MTPSDLLLLLPILVGSATAVLVMLAMAFYRNHKVIVALTLVGLLASLASIIPVLPCMPRQVTPLLSIDGYALLFMALILVSTFIVTMQSYSYLEKNQGIREEYYLLLVLAAIGGLVLVAASHFASFFLGLELLSVSLYALVAYLRERSLCSEAGFKYLTLAGVSSAFLLFGMALIYDQFGTMQFSAIGNVIVYGPAPNHPILSPIIILTGLAMIVVAIGFKLSLVPFHQWTPDVYEGAPAPVTAFIATVSKVAVFAVLLRLTLHLVIPLNSSLFWVFTILAILSMFGGNLLALLQHNVKRLLAYSSIAHMGYLLVAFVAGGGFATFAVIFYLITYLVTSLGSFGVVSALSDGTRDADHLDDYRGLIWRKPWLGAIFTLTLLSLAGIPLTVGFIGKFFLLAAGVNAGLWMLVVILVVNSGIGIYYYLRIVLALYQHPEEQPISRQPAIPILDGLALALVSIMLIWLGVYPSPLIRLIQEALQRFL